MHKIIPNSKSNFSSQCTNNEYESNLCFINKDDEFHENKPLNNSLSDLYKEFWETSLENKIKLYSYFKKTFQSAFYDLSEKNASANLPPAFHECALALQRSPDLDSFFNHYTQSGEEIAISLKIWDDFYYKPNPGNVGDALIAVSTCDLFYNNSLNFKFYNDLTEQISAYNLVYGGGGSCIPDWGCLPNLIHLFSDPRIQQGMILPQSFNDCLPLLEILDERFTVFCRDKNSFFYCKANNDRARFLLADDMAISFDVAHFFQRKEDLTSFDDFCLKQQVIHHLADLPDGRKVLLFIRADRESAIKIKQSFIASYGTLDLSALNSDECDDFGKNELFAQRFLSCIGEADIVLTDRLHGAIGSCLMNKEVYMLDNSYGKLSNVYEHSLIKHQNVHFLNSPEEFPYWHKMKENVFLHDQAIIPLKPLRTGERSFLLGARFISKQESFHVHAEIFDVQQEEDLDYRSDPWVMMLIFHMMSHGGEFHIKGSVSRSLLENIQKLIAYWSNISPQVCQTLTLIPEEIFEDGNLSISSRDTIVCFSGGLDASFTAYRHTHGLSGYNTLQIKAGMMVAGANIPLAQEKFQQESLERSCLMLKDLGIDRLHLIKTNFREFPLKGTEKGCEWGPYTHIACIVGLSCLLSPNYPHVLFGSTYPYKEAFHKIWGSNPVSDPLFSSKSFQSHPDGLEYGRTEKAALINKWNLGMNLLRVCWKNVYQDNPQHNCGECEKCLRTNLNFLATGVKPLNFPDVTSSLLENVKDDILALPEEYQGIIEYAQQHGRGELWWVLQLKRMFAEYDEQQKVAYHIHVMGTESSSLTNSVEWKQCLNNFLSKHEFLTQNIVLQFLKNNASFIDNSEDWEEYLLSWMNQRNLFIEHKNSKRVRKLNKIVNLISKFIIFPKARRKFINSYKFNF